MKIKSIVLLAIILGATTSVKADPLSLILNVLSGGQHNTPVYYEDQCYRPQYQQRDTFHEKVIKVDRNGDARRTAPPPQAFVHVAYPGPAPKYLYDDKSIRVHDRGDMHYVTYRKPGW